MRGVCSGNGCASVVGTIIREQNGCVGICRGVQEERMSDLLDRWAQIADYLKVSERIGGFFI